MGIILEKDEKGLYHQVEMTLEDVANAGRNITLMSMQCYVLFTPEQEAARAAEIAAARAAQKAREDEVAAIQAVKKEQQIAQELRITEITKVKKEAEDAKDNALAFALSKLQDLQAKVDAMEAAASKG